MGNKKEFFQRINENSEERKSRREGFIRVSFAEQDFEKESS